MDVKSARLTSVHSLIWGVLSSIVAPAGVAVLFGVVVAFGVAVLVVNGNALSTFGTRRSKPIRHGVA